MAVRYTEHSGWEQGSSDFPNPWGDAANLWFDMVTVESPCASPSMELRFLSGTDQGEEDECEPSIMLSLKICSEQNSPAACKS